MKDLETHFNEITAGAPTGTLRDGSPCAYMFDGHIILNTGYIIYKSPGVYFETTDPELFRAFLRLLGAKRGDDWSGLAKYTQHS
jgi:hypothetical protein